MAGGHTVASQGHSGVSGPREGKRPTDVVWFERIALMDEKEIAGTLPVIDYDEALDRFGGNSALYKRLASKFTEDPHFADMEEALARNDAEEAYRAAHALKGVSGNLSFSELYSIAGSMSALLRDGDKETAAELLPSAKQAYVRVLDALVDLESLSL
uniref:Hpt domain-containing protein n=1 Tax=Muribaculaceae bacterium Z82 TaxID=2304548 RepID=A0A7C9JDK0_9BACT